MGLIAQGKMVSVQSCWWISSPSLLDQRVKPVRIVPWRPTGSVVLVMVLLFGSGCLLDWNGQPLDAAVVSPPPVDLPIGSEPASTIDLLIPTDSTPTDPFPSVILPAGRFIMGSPPEELCRDRSTETQRFVVTSRGLEVSATEVTQLQYLRLIKTNPADFSPQGTQGPCGLECPVERVSWEDAVQYCNALSTLRGLPSCYAYSDEQQLWSNIDYPVDKILDCPGYRLPTSAEWEYAYRGGDQAAYHDGTNPQSCLILPEGSDLGWYAGNASSPHPVAQKAANGWGLFDMAGNVSEWCHDWYAEDPWLEWGHQQEGPAWPPPLPPAQETGRVIKTNNLESLPTLYDPLNVEGMMRIRRGGSFRDGAGSLRGAANVPSFARQSFNEFGFRCVRSLPTTSWVFRPFILPTQKGDFAMLFDDSGVPKNFLAQLVASVISILSIVPGGVDIQQTFDEFMAEGKLSVMMRLFGGEAHPAALVQLLKAVDFDGDMTDNYSGEEPFGIDYTLSGMGLLPGTLVQGLLRVGPAPLSLWLFYGLNRRITMTHGLLQATVHPGTADAPATISGQMGGVITEQEAFNAIFPLVVDIVNDLLSNPTIENETRQALSNIFDVDKDGKVSIEEVRDSVIAKELMQPDIDTDGNKTNDSFSMAVGFEAVKCNILP